MGALVTNNAVGTLASSMNDSATALVLASGQGALFPNPTGDDYFYVTVVDTSNNKEIMKCTGRATNTLTVVRAQDNTIARAFATDDRVELRPVAALHNNYMQKDSPNTLVGDQVITGDLDVSGAVNGASGSIDDLETEGLHVNGAVETDRTLDFETDGGLRWRMRANDTAEEGSNAGSDLRLEAYSDAEALLATAMSVARATGVMTVLAGFKIGANKGDAFATGTKLIFPQAAAPTGWAQDSDANDRMLRIVSAAGAGTGGSWTISGLSVDGHALTVSEIPSHSHTIKGFYKFVAGGGGTAAYCNNASDGGPSSTQLSADNTGGGAAHSHGVTSANTWRPAYLDAIKCSKSA